MIRRSIAIISMAIFLLTVLPGAASADPQGAQSAQAQALGDAEQAKLIQEFVDRIESRFGQRLDPADYEVRDDQHGQRVQPKGSTVTTSMSTQADGSGGAVSYATVATPPTPEEMAAGPVTIQQETRWYTPFCFSRFEDHVAWMDTCDQWGDMNYVGQTSPNWAYRLYASCGAKEGSPDLTQVGSCFVQSKPSECSGCASWRWNAWSPTAAEQLNPCGSIPLSVSVGPVNAGTSVNTCEKHTFAKGVDGADFRTTWIGKSYWAEDVRATGFLISIGQPDPGNYGLSLQWGFSWDRCVIPPEVGWWCAF